MRVRSMLRTMVVSGFAAALVACATTTEEPTGAPEGTSKEETGSNADVLEAVRALPEAQVIASTDDGVATELRGELAKVGDMQAEDRVTADLMLRPALGPVLRPFRLLPEEVERRATGRSPVRRFQRSSRSLSIGSVPKSSISFL